MKASFALLPMLAITTMSVAAQTRRASPRPVGTVAPTTKTEREGPSATDAIKACRATGEVPCKGVWHDASFELYGDYSGSITIKGADGQAVKWQIGCNYDRVEGYQSCNIEQNGFRVFIMRSSSYFLAWGKELYPNSALIAKVGDHPALRFIGKEVVNGRDAGTVMSLLRTNDHAIFRWSDWPYNADHDIDVDSHSFNAVMAVFDAADAEYAANRSDR